MIFYDILKDTYMVFVEAVANQIGSLNQENEPSNQSLHNIHLSSFCRERIYSFIYPPTRVVRKKIVLFSFPIKRL